MLGVMLARLAGVMRGVSGMAVRRMGVVRGGLMRIRFVMLGCLAMMLGGVLVMFGCGVMMIDDLVLGHDALRPVNGEAAASSPADSRKVMLHGREEPAAVDMRLVRRHAETALPEFTAAALADVAAELVFGPHEFGVVVVGPHARPSRLGELGAVMQRA
jgi:hypothetical protein